MKWGIFLIFVTIALLLESTVTNLPLVLLVLFFAAVVMWSNALFFWSFLIGLLLDSLRLQVIGISSLFFLLFLALVFLYDRKFETKSVPFVLIFSFLGSICYLWIFGAAVVFLYAGVCAALASFSLWIFLFLQKRFLVKS